MTPTSDWYRQYMSHVAANVMDRDGNVRFTYKQLRGALDAVTSNHNEDVPEDVLRLFANIINALPPITLSDRAERVLFLALLNCHMAYLLCTGYLINKDESIGGDDDDLGEEELF